MSDDSGRNASNRADSNRADSDLVAQSQRGDTSAFSQLVRRHDHQMRGVVWRLVPSRAEMDDILQDAYLKAWRGLDGFRGDAAFGSWLYRIVYTTALDQLKATARRRIVPLDEAAYPAVEDVSGAIVDSFELRGALATLPADQLAVITLVDGQGESYEEVASLLGISPGTVGSRLSRGRAALRRQLDNDVTSSTEGGRS